MHNTLKTTTPNLSANARCAVNWQCVRLGEWQRGKESGDTDESNVLLDVPTTILGPSEAKKTEDTVEVESKGCQSGTGVYACIVGR